MSNSFKGYIYCVTNDVNGKKYVGQTSTTVQKRYAEHLRCANAGDDSSPVFYRAIRKYGDMHFSVETLNTMQAKSRKGLKEELLNQCEAYNIKVLGTEFPSGYNMTSGGDAFADHFVRGVYEVLADGTVFAHFDSMREAQRTTGVDESRIWHACHSKSHFSGGLFWYLDDCGYHIGQNIGTQSRGANNWSGHKSYVGKPVDRFDKSGNYIDSFQSANSAAEQLNINQAGISKCCLGKRKSAGGYRWAFSQTKLTEEEHQYGR